MAITVLSTTLLAVEVLFNGYKIPNTSSYYTKSWVENNGKNAANYGGYGTACDLSYWGDGSGFSPANDYYVKSGKIATMVRPAALNCRPRTFIWASRTTRPGG